MDGRPWTVWDNLDPAGEPLLPVEWTLIFPEPEEIREVKILWDERSPPGVWSLQASDDAESWRTLHSGREERTSDPSVRGSRFRPKDPLKTRFLRLWIGEGFTSRKVAVREVFVR